MAQGSASEDGPANPDDGNPEKLKKSIISGLNT